MATRVLLFALTTVCIISATGNAASSADPSVGHYREFNDAGGFMNILPPGQDGVLNGVEAIAAQTGTYPPHVRDQLAMYGDLVYNTPGLTEDRLSEFFKDASFGVREDDIDRVYSPTDDVVVVRDRSFGVPHIFGDTRYATMFAQGYTGAEDRLFLMDALRHVGRGRASEFLGASPSNMALDRDQVHAAPYREADLTAQLAFIEASGEEGAAGMADLRAYTDGVNAYIQEALLDPAKLPAEYPALQQLPLPWKREDTVAIASLVGAIFGKGGGGELSNHCGLQRMAAELGSAADARAVFDDFHFANEPEAPATSRRPAPYMHDLGPVDPAAHPDVDCASLQPIDDGVTSVDDVLRAIAGEQPPRTLDGPFGPISLDFTSGMSNAVLVGGSKTVSGDPIAVFGPQTAYFMPQLLVEKDVHGPGIDARGVAFAGTDLYVQLGRGTNYAWSATSSGADNTDQWVLRLCDPAGGVVTPQSMGYLRNGVCEPIETYEHTQIAKPSAGGVPSGPDVVLSWRVERSRHYGPLAARGTLGDGTPIAVASLRSTYNGELNSARGFRRINDPSFMADGYSSFSETMGSGVDYTFNWFYIDSDDIGYQHSCRCPQRAPGVDPYLPAWGDGRYDWRGFIPLDAQPHDINPAEGYITSWNNKQAPEFKSSDREFAFGPSHRSQLLDARATAAIAGGKVDRADVVDVMEDAGTVDLRGQEVLGLLLEAMGPAAPGGSDPRAQAMRDRLATWLTTQTHRRDHERSGEYDDPQAPAIIDAWWPLLSHAMFDDTSGGAIDHLGLLIHDAPQLHLGSAFNDGLYGHVNKDLRRLMGKTQLAPWSRPYCGSGDLQACRATLWSSLSAAAVALEQEFGSPNVADWKRAIADDDVRHSAVGVTNVSAIHWINRPTFQQVVQIEDPQSTATAHGAGWLSATSGKRIGFAFKVEAISDGSGAGRFGLYDFATNKWIDLRDVTAARLPVGSGCGAVTAGGANSMEFSGEATYSGAPGYEVRVCVQDNGDPGQGSDIVHVACGGCPYDTSTAAVSEVLAGGNVKVRGVAAAPPAGGTSNVVMLEPAVGTSGAPGGGLQTVTATVYDAAGNPLAGVPVTLSGAPILSLVPLAAVTDAQGRLTFELRALLPLNGAWTARSGDLQSNPVRIVWQP
jgi:acyl-homoserine lactone acylase PvdQ